MKNISSVPTLGKVRGENIHHLLEEGELGAILEWTVIDKKGLITEHRIKKSESFVRQFLELLWIQMAQIYPDIATPYQVRDITNNLRNVCPQSNILLCTQNPVDDPRGIQVGTGNTAPTINDYVLQTPIANGGGVGQLNYGVTMAFGAPASDTTTSQFTITRNFANASGGLITVVELGLYLLACDGNYTGSYREYLVIRDVIAGGIGVPNGQTLTVNYRLQAII